MNISLTLPAELSCVASVFTENGRMIIQFRRGITATVERCPLSRFSDHEKFDLYLPSEKPGVAAEMAPGLSAAATIEMLNTLAAKAVE